MAKDPHTNEFQVNSEQPNAPDVRTPGRPYCGNCGYDLTGLTESAKCPECGRPLVDVLSRQGGMPLGKRYRSRATMLGLPVIDIALGPHHDGPRGKARGIIAIGDIATGCLAIGGMARGIVAIGGLAIGVFAFGGGAVGLLTACGGGALAIGAATGGMAIATLANGGAAAGVVAQGGGALGLFVRDARSFANTSGASTVFSRLSWFFGPPHPTALSIWQPMLVLLGITLVPAILIAVIALWKTRRSQ